MIYDFNFVNNVVFNWHHRTVDGGDNRSFYTIENNYFKPGPVTPVGDPISYRLLKPETRRSREPSADFGKAYVAGNVVEGNEQVTNDNWAGGVQIDLDRRLHLDPQAVLAHIRADKPYPHAYVAVQPAQDAYEYVLASAGAVRPKRDAVDERVIETVRTGQITARPNAGDLAADLRKVGYADNVIESIIEMTGKGIISNIEQVGGYPEYNGEPYADADGDGMPDEWETKYGLNPYYSLDAAGNLNGDGYTNIEEFLNGRDPRDKAEAWQAPPGYVDQWKGQDLN